ncbi:hypothetical protein GW17_00017695 [Ensete ventricosum]|nr:hypothetical protein GW17_00017695 [Ensete ventricosum]
MVYRELFSGSHKEPHTTVNLQASVSLWLVVVAMAALPPAAATQKNVSCCRWPVIDSCGRCGKRAVRRCGRWQQPPVLLPGRHVADRTGAAPRRLENTTWMLLHRCGGGRRCFCRAQLPSTSRSARNGRMSEYMGESSCPLECLGHLLQLTRSPRSTNGATTPLPASLDRSLGLASRLCSSTLLRIAQFISLGLLRCCGRSLCRSASMTGRRRWNSGLRGVLRRLRNASSLCS